MRDYRYSPDGADPGIPVAQLSTDVVCDLLRDGFDAQHPLETPHADIKARLELELFIRAYSLRR